MMIKLVVLPESCVIRVSIQAGNLPKSLTPNIHVANLSTIHPSKSQKPVMQNLDPADQ